MLNALFQPFVTVYDAIARGKIGNMLFEVDFRPVVYPVHPQIADFRFPQQQIARVVGNAAVKDEIF